MMVSVASTPTSATSSWVSISSKISSSISLAPTSRSARPLPRFLLVLLMPCFMRAQKPPSDSAGASSGEATGSLAGRSGCAGASAGSALSGSALSGSGSDGCGCLPNMRENRPAFLAPPRCSSSRGVRALSSAGSRSSSRETSSFMVSRIHRVGSHPPA